MRNNRITLSMFIVLFLALLIPALTAAEDSEIPQTGLEIRNDGSWTTHQEELDFLQELSEKSERMEYSVYGESAEGRPMHLVRVGYPAPPPDEEIAEGRNIFIVGTFHGNEPSGREMSLKLMRDLAFTDDPELIDLMSKSTILFLPTMNPDGREANRRRNNDNFDLNRDAVTMVTPEGQTIAKIQNEFKPDIILDAHERISGPNISVLGNLNLNVDSDLRALNHELLDDYMIPDLKDAGFTADYYPPGALPANTRSMSGLRHSIGVLTEGSWTDEPLVRVAGQMESAYSILNFYMERFDEVGEVVEQSRLNRKQAGADRSEPFYLDGMEGSLPSDDRYILDPPPYGYLINEAQKERVERQLELFSIEIETVDGGYYIPMDQEMMTVIPFIFDPNSLLKVVSGLPVYDPNDMTPPPLPTPQQYQTDFSEYEAGDIPSDWNNFWADSNWEVSHNPSRLEHVVADGSENYILTWDKVGEVHGDVEVATVVRADREGELFQLHLNGYGRAGREDSYYLNVTKQHGENKLQIHRLHGAIDTEIASTTLPFDVELDTWYQAVFQRDGETLNGKVWKYGEEEPADWQISVDDVYVTFGNVGVGHQSAGMINDFKYFSVGTYGAKAERAPADLLDGTDQSILQRRVDQIKAENLNEDDYLPDSWASLQAALEHAETILEKVNATQAEIDQAVNELYEAYTNLSGQYQTDFSEYVAGEPPEDWTTLWRDSFWTIKDDPSRLEHDTKEGSGRRVLTWDKIGDITGDVEASALVKKSETTSGVLFQLHLQATGNSGSESSYYLDVSNSGSIRINRNRNGGFSVLKTSALPYTPELDTWYQVVFKREGSMLKGKVWPYGEDEPADWQVEVEDDSFITGKVGLGHVTTGLINDWAFVGVGTSNAEAPRAPEDLLVDKTPLENKINEIETSGLVAEDFTEASWGQLQSALDSAKEMLDERNVTQADIYEEILNLDAAFAQLQTRSALFSTNFTEYEVGQAPFDWSTLWRESGWEIKDDPRRLEHSMSLGGSRRVLAWDEVGEVYGDVEVSALVRKTGTTSGVLFQLHLQAADIDGRENSYYLDVRNNGSIRINRNRNGGFAVLGSEPSSYDAELDTWYNVVFKREGTTLKGKVWPYGEDEPEGWQVEVEDETFGKGKVGVGHVTSGVVNDWAFFGVGTNDEQAPRAPKGWIVDKTPLEAKIDDIESLGLESTDFTEESWAGLQHAIDAANEALNKEDVTQAEIVEHVEHIDAAYLALQTASNTLSTDFSEYEVGQAPSDWSTLWRESGWEVKDDPSRLEHYVTEGGKRRVLTWDEADEIYGDVEVSALVKSSGGTTMFQLHLQGSGEAGSEDSYYLDLRDSNSIRINRNLDATFRVLESEPTPFTVEADTWYQLVLKREGTWLKGKAWPLGEEEPEDWQIEVEDDSLVRGQVGFGHVTSGMTNDWAFIGVGTNDQAAPRAPEDIFYEAPIDVLQELVDRVKAEELNDADYTKESWQDFKKALSKAESVLTRARPSEAQINEAIANLEEAYENLQPLMIDGLRDKVNEIKALELNEEDYTRDSWQELHKAMRKAESVLTRSKPSQDQIDEALHDLTAAYENLQPLMIDGLRNKINEIKALELNEDDYTHDSWEELNQALNIAESVLEQTNASQDQLDDALEELIAAFDGLETV